MIRNIIEEIDDLVEDFSTSQRVEYWICHLEERQVLVLCPRSLAWRERLFILGFDSDVGNALLILGTQLCHFLAFFSTFEILSQLSPQSPLLPLVFFSRLSWGQLWFDRFLSWELVIALSVLLCLAKSMKKYLDMSEWKRKWVKSSEHRGIVFDDIGKTDPRPFYNIFKLRSFLLRMQQSSPSFQIRFLGLKIECIIIIFRIDETLWRIGDNLSIISKVSLCLPIFMIGRSPLKHFSLWHLASFPISRLYFISNRSIETLLRGTIFTSHQNIFILH